MSGDQELTSLAEIQASLKRIEERLSNICSNVESLKRAKQLATRLQYIIDSTETVYGTNCCDYASSW